MNISIVMATYNGEKYIKEQLESILPQLNEKDELIITDDGSTDGTLSIIDLFLKQTNNINLVRGPGKGVIKNFENGLKLCNNEIILLSDQDDIWKCNKIQTIKEYFKKNDDIMLVLHNMSLQTNDMLQKKSVIRYRKGVFINIVRSCYWGCCMAFRKELLSEVLPFPKSVPAHDQWIGLCAEKLRKADFIEDDLIIHRVHGENKTKKQKIYKRILFRVRLGKSLLE